MLELPAETIGAIVGLLTIAAALLGVFRVLYNFTKKIEKAIGEDKEGRSINERIGRVEHQVFPNGGSSIADRVNLMQEEVSEVKAKVEIIEALLQTIVQQNGRHNNNK